MKWGVALLDPAAQPAIKAISEKANPNIDPLFAERPLPFGDGINIRDSSKVIVLMTDGKHEGRPFMNADKRRGPTPVYQELTSGDDNLFIYYEDDDNFLDIDNNVRVNSPGSYQITGEEEECTWYQYRRNWYKKCEMVPTYTYVEADMDDENSIRQLTWPELFVLKTESWIDNYGPLYYEPTSGLDFGITPTTQDNNLFASCDAAKKEKILIFTIGFEVEDAYLDVMRDCASTENHFFDVDGTNISAAFAAIASQINRLRLTQ
ncbi:hypothetical protein RC74_10540 [Falsihalocynthiibacter arcticus]|uniref:VWFA domain-containing protein n=2 Tax=Falsihalocynthiibacter arcticus TaxID=1579316 RepID=A0A126UZY9_9RHOB|nr:hypothetical protein RC74_10540 [Falsihalocynthiibacter arcticus]